MQVGMIGLGRMGANMVRRLMRGGHDCVVFDVSPDAITALEGEGATGAPKIEDFVAKLTPPRSICIMVPAAVRSNSHEPTTLPRRQTSAISGMSKSYW